MSGVTQYNAEIQSKADDYVAGLYESCGDPFPSVAGLACYLGRTRECMYEWGRNHPLFSDTLKKCLTAQEKIALAGGITNKFNATITKLVLANHGYSDKQDMTLQGGEKPIKLDVTLSPEEAYRKMIDGV
jgi:hypothetical protein